MSTDATRDPQTLVAFRSDIEWSKLSVNDEQTWVARDPLALEFFYFSDVEHKVAMMLNGERELVQLLQIDSRLTIEWLTALVSKFENACLTTPRRISETGRQLHQAGRRQRRRQTFQQLLNPLAVRVRLFDPTRLLSACRPLASVLFSFPFASVALLLSVIVCFTVANKLAESPTNWLAAIERIGFLNALALGGLFVCVKSLHELGHALACKRWSAECHEIGVMFLVFMPCLYCDTSDCWKLESPLRRACVAAAGIYVELLLATLGAIVWLVSMPGSFLGTLSGQLMLICSVSTILVNANPLLRYDGYYILADLWRVPNLARQSSEAFRALLMSWFRAEPVPSHRWDGNVVMLSTYATLAWAYRQFLGIIIAWLVWTWFDSLGIRLLGLLLMVLTLGNMLFSNVLMVLGFLSELAMTSGVKVFRVTVAVSLLGLAVWAIVLQPMGTFVCARAVTTWAEDVPIFAQHSGNLVEARPSGSIVEKHDVLVQLASPELARELLDASIRVSLLEVKLDQMNHLSTQDESAALQVASVTENLLSARQQHQQLQESQASLTITAEFAGRVRAAQYESDTTLTEQTDRTRSQPTISPKFIGKWVEKGSQLAWLSRESQRRLEAFVSEQELELLYEGMPIRCRWDCQPATTYKGTVLRILQDPIKELPASIAGDPFIQTQANADGVPTPLQPTYLVQIDVPETPPHLNSASRATVHFETAPRTLFQSARRFLEQTIRPNLQ